MQTHAAAYGNKGGHTRSRAKRIRPRKPKVNGNETGQSRSNPNPSSLPSMNVFNNNDKNDLSAKSDRDGGGDEDGVNRATVRCIILPVGIITAMTGNKVFENGVERDKDDVIKSLFNNTDKRLSLERYLGFNAKVNGGRGFPGIVDESCIDHALEDLELFAMDTSFEDSNISRYIVYNTLQDKKQKKIINVNTKETFSGKYTVKCKYIAANLRLQLHRCKYTAANIPLQIYCRNYLTANVSFQIYSGKKVWQYLSIATESLLCLDT